MATTWFITGTSRGLGLELATQLLRRGDNVAATTRSVDRLSGALADTDTERLLPLELDLAEAGAVSEAIERTVQRFGRLDAVVNNAGYGYLASVEDTTDAAARAMLDVQLFGVWNVLRSALPVLRAQRSGHVVNVSSVLGLTAVPGWGLYCAGKFALEGMTEALAGEMTDFDVRVTLVEPGYFRTSFLTPEALALPESTSGEYGGISEMTRAHQDLQGHQLGDPVKAAAALIDLVDRKDTRLRQLLGSDAHAYASAKVAALTSDLEAGREIALSTDFAQ